MFTDMVGYSAIAQRDERLSLALLEEQKTIVRGLFPKHDGREIELIGDAFFIEFSSAVEAAQCAVAIQKAIHERNRESDPDRFITLRIGIHVGDVVHIGEKVHGDGVNIAARIQQVARPGGIALSEDVARQVGTRLEYPLVRLGKGELKNISLPVGIYCVAMPWLGRASGITTKANFTFQKRKTRRILLAAAFVLVAAAAVIITDREEQVFGANSRRIAVLPFLNISPDPADGYFADGMTEELISNLSKIRDLSVIARTSVARYKEAKLDLAQIGAELNVGTILSGSVRKSKDKARISVYLTDVSTQNNIWTDQYDRDLKDVFAVQNDISMRVAEMLKIRLLAPEAERFSDHNTVDPEAYRLYQIGRGLMAKRNVESLSGAIGSFTRSIEADPGFALAHAGLADVYTLVGAAGYEVGISRDSAIARAIASAERAIHLNPTLAEAHATLAYVRFRLEWNFTEAEKGFKTAIDLSPGLAKAWEWYGLYLAIMRRFDEGIAAMRRAEELDPLSPSVGTGLGRVLYFAHKDDSARAQIAKVIRREPNYPEGYFAMAPIMARLGKLDSSIVLFDRAVQLSGSRTIVVAARASMLARVGRTKEAEAVLETFVRPTDGSKPKPYCAALILEGLGRRDEAFEQLEKAYEEREGLLLYLSAEPTDIFTISDPRIISILDRIGLPH